MDKNLSRRKLTKSVVDAAPPRTARYVIWDGIIPGFGLRVTPTVKAFILRYAVATKQEAAGPMRPRPPGSSLGIWLAIWGGNDVRLSCVCQRRPRLRCALIKTKMTFSRPGVLASERFAPGDGSTLPGKPKATKFSFRCQFIRGMSVETSIRLACPNLKRSRDEQRAALARPLSRHCDRATDGDGSLCSA